MASLQSIAKAKAFGEALFRFFGEQPDYEYRQDFVRVYYTPDKLLRVQKKIDQLSSVSPGDVRIEWLPMVSPMAIKKVAPFAVGLVALGFILGRI